MNIKNGKSDTNEEVIIIILIINPKIRAKQKLDNGPAKASIAESRRGILRFRGL